MVSKLRAMWEKRKARYRQRGTRPFGSEHLDEDVYLVIEAASDLDIPEFELFCKAYEKWFGRAADEAQVERYYLGYMFAERVPHWVREYCRQVAASARRHELDPVSFGVQPQLSRRVKTGLTMLAAAFMLVAALVTVAEYTVDRHFQHLRQLNDPQITHRP